MRKSGNSSFYVFWRIAKHCLLLNIAFGIFEAILTCTALPHCVASWLAFFAENIWCNLLARWHAMARRSVSANAWRSLTSNYPGHPDLLICRNSSLNHVWDYTSTAFSDLSCLIINLIGSLTKKNALMQWRVAWAWALKSPVGSSHQPAKLT